MNSPLVSFFHFNGTSSRDKTRKALTGQPETLFLLPAVPSRAEGEHLPAAQLSVDLYLKNQALPKQTLQNVIVEFPGSDLAPIVLGTGLKMNCPPPSKTVQTAPLVLEKDKLCKVALLSDSGQDMRLPVPVPPQVAIHVFFAGSPELVFGLPVYAMADGVVTACQDGTDDNEVGKNGTTANSVSILHGVETAWYGHLKKGTIDKAICQKDKPVKEATPPSRSPPYGPAVTSSS